MYNIGLSIPENAVFPPWVVDIDTAVKAIDIAYHLNHRKDGKPLFDMKTGTMSEGIGHYGYERDRSGKNRVVNATILTLALLTVESLPLWRVSFRRTRW